MLLAQLTKMNTATVITQWIDHVAKTFMAGNGPNLVASVPLEVSHPFYTPLKLATSNVCRPPSPAAQGLKHEVLTTSADSFFRPVFTGLTSTNHLRIHRNTGESCLTSCSSTAIRTRRQCKRCPPRACGRLPAFSLSLHVSSKIASIS